jgi:hypothetical protein
MKTLLTLFAVALLSVTTSTLSSSDVSGAWDLEMTWGEEVKSTGVCALNQEGETLTGTCGGSEKFPIAGTVRNSRLSWRVDVEQDGDQGRMEFAGQLDARGTTISGSCSIVGGRNGTFTMKKRS